MPDTPPQHTLSRRRFLQTALASAVGTTVAGVATSFYGTQIEPNDIEITQIEPGLPRLHHAFDGYRIVQISDIHMGTWMTRERLEHVVALVNEQQPELIVITGDFVTTDPIEPYADSLIHPLRKLNAPDGVVAVLGNHDHWTNHEMVRRILSQSEITDLSNQVMTLGREGAQLHIAGVDDYWERKADLKAVLEQLPEEGAAVLLAHEPDYADISTKTGRFDLQLSGHSHGGQVILPLLGPPRLPRYGKKYPLGQYLVDNMIQYTNRGVGMIRPAVRFNCRPEISVFTLRAASLA